MDEYIKREDALGVLHGLGGCGADPGTWADGWDKAINAAYCEIADHPAADVAPQKWIRTEDQLPEAPKETDHEKKAQETEVLRGVQGKLLPGAQHQDRNDSSQMLPMQMAGARDEGMSTKSENNYKILYEQTKKLLERYQDDLVPAMRKELEQKEEVVHCKDCKRLTFSDCYGECRGGYLGIVRPDDYCSRGERREVQ